MKSKLKLLHVQVLIGIAAGLLLGFASPSLAVQMKPFGDGFIALLRMLITPIIFFTVVHSLGEIRDMSRLGRLAIKTLVYFEIVSTLGLILGLALVNLVEPGVGLHATATAGNLPDAVRQAQNGVFSIATLLIHIIPTTPVDAFARGEVLQVLFISIIAGLALSLFPKRESVLRDAIRDGQGVLFIVLNLIMRVAPIGAFGAVAATIGGYGGGAIIYLGKVIALYYASAVLFVVIVLGAATLLARVSLWRILLLIKEEILLVLSTSSSEVAFPRLIQKLKRAGCDEAVVGFVLPAGYSFNLDGTSLYMAIGVGFIAQATDTPFPLESQIGLLAILMLTSKGGATVAGGSFIKLAATLQSTHALPLSGLGLLFGIDRFMAVCGGLINMIGNAVAVVVIARWERAFDPVAFRRAGATPTPGDGAGAVTEPEEAGRREA